MSMPQSETILSFFPHSKPQSTVQKPYLIWPRHSDSVCRCAVRVELALWYGFLRLHFACQVFRGTFSAHQTPAEVDKWSVLF